MARSPGTVLVTGGTGFIGGWCIADLVAKGYTVRATVRDLTRSGQVTEAISRTGDRKPAIEFVTADLNADDGWDQAMAGVRAVMQVASPMGIIGGGSAESLVSRCRARVRGSRRGGCGTDRDDVGRQRLQPVLLRQRRRHRRNAVDRPRRPDTDSVPSRQDSRRTVGLGPGGETRQPGAGHHPPGCGVWACVIGIDRRLSRDNRPDAGGQDAPAATDRLRNRRCSRPCSPPQPRPG
jgi:hypothetical protein